MFRRVFMILAIGGIAACPASAGELSGYLVGTTDYVYRGVTQSDGHGAAQLGLDVSTSSIACTSALFFLVSSASGWGCENVP